MYKPIPCSRPSTGTTIAMHFRFQRPHRGTWLSYIWIGMAKPGISVQWLIPKEIYIKKYKRTYGLARNQLPAELWYAYNISGAASLKVTRNTFRRPRHLLSQIYISEYSGILSVADRLDMSCSVAIGVGGTASSGFKPLVIIMN